MLTLDFELSFEPDPGYQVELVFYPVVLIFHIKAGFYNLFAVHEDDGGNYTALVVDLENEIATSPHLSQLCLRQDKYDGFLETSFRVNRIEGENYAGYLSAQG